MIKFGKISFLMLMISFTILSSCKKHETSATTGWNFNDPKNGGFEVSQNREQITPPNMVYIEGGTFVMGGTQENLFYEWDNMPRRATVSSFYMDQTEVSNLDYLEYIHWLDRVFGENYPQVVKKALPDTLVWRGRLSYNEPLVENYFRHPSYHDYPVVGVSWLQANDYSSWRTDRVNELLLVQEGILDWNTEDKDDNNFNTLAYVYGQYEGNVKEGKKNLSKDGETRNVTLQDGILLPRFRLPTEAEWEYAALGLIGNTLYERRVTERRRFPWNGNFTRTNERKYEGNFLANYKRGKGDFMGVAGDLMDQADIPAPVGSYWPNDYGLYNMAGNVSEWVLDVYRPLSFEDVDDLNPFRGNVFTHIATDEEGMVQPKDSLGRIPNRNVTAEESAARKNYRRANNINYRDGDEPSLANGDWKQQNEENPVTNKMYDYGETSLINDKARVYKGGSWNDRAYYLSPGVRRFLNEDEASSTIGFRCAMSRVGPAVPSGAR